MRAISADLAAVQLVRSPRARVTVTAATRGQNPAAPAVAWTELVANPGQLFFRPMAVCTRVNGWVLRFRVNGSTVERQTITNPSDPAAWTSTAWASAFTSSALAIGAQRDTGLNQIRLYYVHSDQRVYMRRSDDHGATWTAATAVYSTTNAAADVVCAYLNDGVVTNGPMFVGFSTYDSATGIYTPRFGGRISGTWTTWPYLPGWRAAGIDVHGPAQANLRVLVFRQGEQGMSRLRMLDLNCTTGVYSNPQDLDITQAGQFGLMLSWYRFHQLDEVGCTMGAVVESALGRGNYAGVAGLFTRPDTATNPAADVRVVDEPVMLPKIVQPRNMAYLDVVARTNGDVYLVGDEVVYRGVAQSAPSGTLTPIRYRYDENVMELEFAAGTTGLAIGQRLTVTRTLSWGSQSGSQSIGVYVMRVEAGTARVRVVAMDGLGMLGTMRCRRPVVLNDGSAAGAAQALRRLAARAGIPLRVDRLSLESGSVLPVTVQANESLRSAAYRVGSQVVGYLVPANDGSLGVTLIAPPTSVSGHYVDAPHLYGGSGELYVTDAAEVTDYRELAFSYVMGTYSTDPEDGAALAMAAGPVLPNTRPMSYSLTNRRYNSFGRVEAAAEAEADRQKAVPVRAEMETPANLALELYDVVRVTVPSLGWSAREWRVRRISEMYDRGRLTQHVWLGDV